MIGDKVLHLPERMCILSCKELDENTQSKDARKRMFRKQEEGMPEIRLLFLMGVSGIGHAFD